MCIKNDLVGCSRIPEREIAKMSNYEDRYLSVRLTRFFLKFVGFWSVDNWKEQLMLDAALVYTVAALIFSIGVLLVDLFHCWADFDARAYNLCATMTLTLVLIKVSVFILQRRSVIDLIGYTKKNFWQVNYDSFGRQIMKECESKAVLFASTFTFLVWGVVFNYLLAPIVENISHNDTDHRVTPFKLWVDLPLTVSPYFEMAFVVQSLSTIHSGVCFLCFDNLLCVLTIYVRGQFQILQHRVKIICERYSESESSICEESSDDIAQQTEIYEEFKSCVVKHWTLIDYIEKLEKLFTVILLCQMVVSSLLLCLAGFQVFLAERTLVRRLIFVSHMLGCATQLLLFTWTCNEIIVQSTSIADAAYQMKWYLIPHHGKGISLRNGILIMMARVNRPCFLSAGKFCPMSLQAFTSVLSTAASYFTLLRQLSEDLEN